MRHSWWNRHYDDRGNATSSRVEDVVGRKHDLLGVQTELDRDVLEAVERGSVNVGLARLPESPITHPDPVAV